MENITYLQIEPTTYCNFHCSFCCGRSDEQKSINFDSFKKAIDSLPHLEHVHIQGEGEPFLNPDLFKMIRYAKERGIIVTTISNGSLLCENIENVIESGLDKIAISIESDIKEQFQEIRGGDLEIIKYGIKNLIIERDKQGAVRPAVGFEVLFMKKTMNRLDHIYELYEQLGMDGGILLQALCTRQEYMKHYSDELIKQITSEEETKMLLARGDKLSKRLSINKAVKRDMDMLDPKLSHEELCPYLKRSVFINAKNHVSFCCSIREELSDSLGNLENMDMVFQRRKEKLELLEQKGIIPPECRLCQGDGFSSTIARN